MQAVVAVLPELDLVGLDDVAAPERRQRDVAVVAEAGAHLLHRRLQVRTRLPTTSLWRDAHALSRLSRGRRSQ